MGRLIFPDALAAFANFSFTTYAFGTSEVVAQERTFLDIAAEWPDGFKEMDSEASLTKDDFVVAFPEAPTDNPVILIGTCVNPEASGSERFKWTQELKRTVNGNSFSALEKLLDVVKNDKS